jgi:hypothetical protein
MHLLGTQMAAFTDALEESQHQLPLRGETLAAIVQAAAQGAGLDGEVGGGLRRAAAAAHPALPRCSQE